MALSNELDLVESFPKRPAWSYQDTIEELESREQSYFAKWMNFIRSKEEISFVEQNLEVWRQFWRVLEKSDIIALVTDARYPPLHIPHGLINCITQELKKPVILVLNKTDLVTQERVVSWRRYLFERIPEISNVVEFSCFESRKDVLDDSSLGILAL